MKRKDWQALFDQFPPGLSGAEIARRIKQPPQKTQYWLRLLKYNTTDGRKHPSPEKFNSIRRVQGQIDWSEPCNQVLATRHGVSRERIRQLRKRIL